MAQGLTQMAFAGQVSQSVSLIGHTVGYTEVRRSVAHRRRPVRRHGGQRDRRSRSATTSRRPVTVTVVERARHHRRSHAVIDPLKPVAAGHRRVRSRRRRLRLRVGRRSATCCARSSARRSRCKFSGHALDRIRQRGIPVDRPALGSAGVDRAAAKGARTALVLVDQAAFVVAAQNRTVITAVDREHMQEQVFTNIDSAVIA